MNAKRTGAEAPCQPAPIAREAFFSIRQTGDPDRAYAEVSRILSDTGREPWEALSECDPWIDGFGVESLSLPDGGELLYVNKGDTYDATLCHTEAEGFFVSSWGDVYEAAESARTEETGETRCAYCGAWGEPEDSCGSCGRDPRTGDPVPDLLRHVRLETGHTLRTWDTGRTDGRGRTRIGYVFADPDGAPIFDGDDFRCSPLHADDSDDALRALLGFLSLRPGDTDPEYFADHTAAQTAFCESSECEYVAFLYGSEEGPGAFEEVEGGAA